MQRIIFNPNFMDKPICLDGTIVPDAWDVSIWEVNGHREISARNVVRWEENEDWVPPVDQTGTLRGDEMAEERRLRKLESNAKRAQTTCRRVIKAEGFDEILTLSYRENQRDRDLCKKHFAEWARRMKRAMGGFRYCAAFERQERGAMHVHVACHKLPAAGKLGGVNQHKLGYLVKAWKIGTMIWRSIVGSDNGLCFVGGKTKFGAPSKRKISLAKMAGYVSKYIIKDYADSPDASNRYSRSQGTEVAKPKRLQLDNCTMADLVALCFQCGDGDVIVSHRVDSENRRYWLCTEPNPDLLPCRVEV